MTESSVTKLAWAILLWGFYWGCAACKGHFLSPDSQAKGVFGTNSQDNDIFFLKSLAKGLLFMEPPENQHLGAKPLVIVQSFLLLREVGVKIGPSYRRTG